MNEAEFVKWGAAAISFVVILCVALLAIPIATVVGTAYGMFCGVRLMVIAWRQVFNSVVD